MREERGHCYPSDDPIAIDVFDQAVGQLTDATVNYICDDIRQQIELDASVRLLEWITRSQKNPVKTAQSVSAVVQWR